MRSPAASVRVLVTLFAASAFACQAPSSPQKIEPRELVVSRLVVQGDGGSRAVIEDVVGGMAIKLYSPGDGDTPSLVLGVLPNQGRDCKGLWMTDPAHKSVVLLDTSATTDGFPLSRLAFGDYPAPFVNSTYLCLMAGRTFPSSVCVFDTRNPAIWGDGVGVSTHRGWMLGWDGAQELLTPEAPDKNDQAPR